MKTALAFCVLAWAALAVGLAGCTSGPTAQDCETARLAVTWAQDVLARTCTRQSQACEAAGLGLLVANTSARLVCPTGSSVAP